MDDRDAQDVHMARHMADDGGGNGERKRHGGTKALSVVAIVMSGFALAGTIASVTMTSVLVRGMASGIPPADFYVSSLTHIRMYHNIHPTGQARGFSCFTI